MLANDDGSNRGKDIRSMCLSPATLGAAEGSNVAAVTLKIEQPTHIAEQRII